MHSLHWNGRKLGRVYLLSWALYHMLMMITKFKVHVKQNIWCNID